MEPKTPIRAKRKLVAVIVMCGLLLLCLYPLFPSRQERTLLSAYRRYEQVDGHAWLTLDTSGLSAVETGEVLAYSLEGIEALRKRGLTSSVSDKVFVLPFGMEILEYQADYAHFIVLQRRVAVRIDKQTGKLIYGSGATNWLTNWYSHEVEAVKEDGVWKVSKTIMMEDLIDPH